MNRMSTLTGVPTPSGNTSRSSSTCSSCACSAAAGRRSRPGTACRRWPGRYCRRSLRGGAGEGARPGAEQLRFWMQRLGNRRAVDRHKRLVSPLARSMQGAREDLLAGARFANQQDRDIPGDHTFGRPDVARHHRIADVQLVQGAAACGRTADSSRGAMRLRSGPRWVDSGLGDREEAAAVSRLVDRQRVERLVAAVDQRRQRDVEDALERRLRSSAVLQPSWKSALRSTAEIAPRDRTR